MIYEKGFTAVELLVSIFIGVMLLGAGYQLYSVAMQSSGDAQRRSQASNVAYDLLRNAQPSISDPCAPSTSAPAVPASSGLTGATAALAATCPYSNVNYTSSVTLLTITVTYDGGRQVTRALAVKK